MTIALTLGRLYCNEQYTMQTSQLAANNAAGMMIISKYYSAADLKWAMKQQAAYLYTLGNQHDSWCCSAAVYDAGGF